VYVGVTAQVTEQVYFELDSFGERDPVPKFHASPLAIDLILSLAFMQLGLA